MTMTMTMPIYDWGWQGPFTPLKNRMYLIKSQNLSASSPDLTDVHNIASFPGSGVAMLLLLATLWESYSGCSFTNLAVEYPHLLCQEYYICMYCTLFSDQRLITKYIYTTNLAAC